MTIRRDFIGTEVVPFPKTAARIRVFLQPVKAPYPPRSFLIWLPIENRDSTAAHTLTPKAAVTVSPIAAGDLATRMPASSMAWIFSWAVPFPPEMIAPA